jgi:hypothetical protein
MTRSAVFPQQVRDAIDSDLDRLGLSEAELGNRLHITQQAINKWRRMGVIPFRKFDEVVAVLGPDSALAKLGIDGMFAAKENRHHILAKAVEDRTLTPEQASEIAYKGMPEPGAVLRDLRRVRGQLAGLPVSYNTDPVPARPTLRERQDARTALETAFRDSLPEDLRQYVDRDRFDYHSPALVLEIRWHEVRHLAISAPSILKAASARARGDAARAAVAVFGDDIHAPKLLLDDAKDLGVEVWMLRDMNDLVRRISEAEGIRSETVEAEEDYD